MGLAFTLTSFTCTVQFVGTLLIAASQGHWLWPLLGMIVFSSVFAFPFFLLGLLIAFGSKVEYEASCKLMPESQEGMKPNLGGLGSLAGLAGINLDMGGSGALTPELYPQIAQSVPFLLKILNEPIHFEKQDTTTTSYIFFKAST